MPHTLDNVIGKRVEALTACQDAAYALRDATLVAQVRATETARGLGSKLSIAAATYYFKLMACKDEYEVARRYTDGRFVDQLKTRFEGDFSLTFHLAPPLLAKKDGKGRLVKAEFGSWMWHAFRLLARLKILRGGAFDVFGYSEERRMERALINEYHAMIEGLLAGLNADTVANAIAPARLPEQVRGFGHVKQAAAARFRA